MLSNGVAREDRTGTGTKAVFGRQLRVDLSKGFPLLTTKKLHIRSIVHELLWFLKGDTNIAYLNENKVSIWDEWADDQGELGPVYGKQWRNWQDQHGNVHDQVANMVNMIKTDPQSRRIILSSWNVGDLSQMNLQPCHVLVQAWVHKDKLSLQLYQRSADLFLGVPFNIATYSLLTHLLAQVCDLKAAEFIHSFGDVHIYNDHIDKVELQLQREPKALPTLVLNPSIKDIFDFSFEDISIKDYDPHPSIKAKVSI